MQFLSDVFIRCPDCDGRRYRPHILEVKIRSRRRESARSVVVRSQRRLTSAATNQEWSIADLLEATVDEAIEFLAAFPGSRPARSGGEKLKLLREVGLGYLRLGQPINTLSGGESQRLKLVSHLAEADLAQASCLPVARRLRRQTGAEEAHRGKDAAQPPRKDVGATSADALKPTLFLFDEPTTGLHFDDVRLLLKVFQRLVDAGHSVLVIEHNLDVIKCADWVIDLGPEAGDEGGQIVAEGTPEEIVACERSHTGTALLDVLGIGSSTSAPIRIRGEANREARDGRTKEALP